MTNILGPRSEHHIMAVIALYKCAPSESQSLCSLLEIARARPDLAKQFSLMLYDNSPVRQDFELDTRLPIAYRHGPENGGLAAAFNCALSYAEEMHCEWLLLLDQDTSPTTEFLTELVECTHAVSSRLNVASIVPKLLVDGKICSPEAHFIDQMRHQYKRSSHSVAPNTVGVQERRLSAYNSGATFRTSALRSIGGFPKEFWLDYLDHAVFHALSFSGYQMYILATQIKHEHSQKNLGQVPTWRQRNILWAQTLFVMRTGNIADRLLYRIWLVRYSRSLWIHHPDKRLWREALLQAVLLRARKAAIS